MIGFVIMIGPKNPHDKYDDDMIQHLNIGYWQSVGPMNCRLLPSLALRSTGSTASSSSEKLRWKDGFNGGYEWLLVCGSLSVNMVTWWLILISNGQ